MKIGYPCLNHSLGEEAYKTFRLASYSDERFIATVEHNLNYVKRMLDFNIKHGLMFLRISSGIVPFGSHQVLKVDWQERFKDELKEIGSIIKRSDMRISMHPDQFVLINSPRKDVVEASVRDLVWQTGFMDLMGLDSSAKLQIHVGGVYGDRRRAIRSFIANYVQLPSIVKERLVIENDDKSFPLNDCLKIHEAVGIPVLFDNFHHQCINQGETLFEAMMMANDTWDKKDGLMMVDYSEQAPGGVKGKHVNTIDINKFSEFLRATQGMDFDIMLEIKDKEKSALKAIDVLKQVREEMTV